MRATYLEIYQEEVRDLLGKNPQQRLELKESVDRGVYVKGLMQFVVKGVAEINSVLQVGTSLTAAAASLAEPVVRMQPNPQAQHAARFLSPTLPAASAGPSALRTQTGSACACLQLQMQHSACLIQEGRHV